MQGRAKALINLHRRFASSQSVIVKKRSKRIEKAQIVCALHVPGPPPHPHGMVPPTSTTSTSTSTTSTTSTSTT